MTVTLTPEQEKFVSEQIKSGHFKSAAGVVAQGLGMLRAQEQFIQTHASELREKIAVGLDEIRRGDVIDGRVVFDRLLKRNRRRRRRAGHS
jgi:antitoxin ParD1/3/4